MHPPPLILASASPRRQELLRSAGISFEIIPSEVEEEWGEGETPEAYVVRLARLKAVKVGERHKTRWVLAADTIVVIDGRILGKPRDRREAQGMLEMLSDREHRVVTGYCLLQICSGKSRQGSVVSRVRFKELSPDEVRWYLDTGEPFDKAGAYAIQGKAAFMVKEVQGSYTNVVGLPLCEIVEALRGMEGFTINPQSRASNHK
jgi:nucleoside triphosphate pyrophosphatase